MLMNINELIGTWIGSFKSYDDKHWLDGYENKYDIIGKATNKKNSEFKMEILAQESGVFFGTIFDVVENLASSIKGSIKDDEIEFIKTYDSIPIIPKGHIYSKLVDHKMEIIYDGFLDGNNSIIGTWKREKKTVQYMGESYIIPEDSGSWNVKKENLKSA